MRQVSSSTSVTSPIKHDALYVLDTTHPGAQQYLRQTYSTLYNWGVRFIKMDFMDDTAVEGAYYRARTRRRWRRNGSA